MGTRVIILPRRVLLRLLRHCNKTPVTVIHTLRKTGSENKKTKQTVFNLYSYMKGVYVVK